MPSGRLNLTTRNQITFTLRRLTCPQVYINDELIPQTDSVRYLGLTLDRRLTWGPHTRNTNQAITRRIKSLYTLLNPKSKLSLVQKLNIYTHLIKPIWSYGIQIYGTSKNSNINKIQIQQSKFLRLISQAPRYISNKTLHTDFKLLTIHKYTKLYYTRFHNKLHGHPNHLIHHMSTPHLPDNPPRRLKRCWTRDLLGVSDRVW